MVVVVVVMGWVGLVFGDGFLESFVWRDKKLNASRL